MTPENFVYYLQGFLELTEEPGAVSTPPTPAQWSMIREALASVFCKVTSPLEESTAESEPIRSSVGAIAAIQEEYAQKQRELIKELAETRQLAQRADRNSRGRERIC